MLVAQAWRDRGYAFVRGLEGIARAAREVEHVGEVGVAVGNPVEVVHLAGDLDRALHVGHPLVHPAESNHRHPERVERLSLDGCVAALHGE